MEKIYVQYGCGFFSSPHWRNFDSSPTLRFERIPVIGKLYTKNATRFPSDVEYGDIVKGLPLGADSCDGIYCSHVLEHLSYDECITALSNTYKILKSGAIFRLVLPDLRFYIDQYISDSSTNAAIKFMQETGLGVHKNPKKIISVFGASKHKWMWDFESLSYQLSLAGFVEIRRATYSDSTNLMFSMVEQKSRWINCLGIECKKP